MKEVFDPQTVRPLLPDARLRGDPAGRLMILRGEELTSRSVEASAEKFRRSERPLFDGVWTQPLPSSVVVNFPLDPRDQEPTRLYRNFPGSRRPVPS